MLGPLRLSLHHAEVLQEVQRAVDVVHYELLKGLGPVTQAGLADDRGDALADELVDQCSRARVADLRGPRQHVLEAEDLRHRLAGLVDLLPDLQIDGVDEVGFR